MVRRFLLGLILWATFILPASAAVLKDMKIVEGKNDIDVIIEGGYTSYRAFTLPKPARLVVDFEGTTPEKGLPHFLKIKSPIVSKIRVGKGENKVLTTSFEREDF